MTPVVSRAELERLLEDDVPYGDLTTEALGIGGSAGIMRFAARDPMVLALAKEAAAIVELAGCRVELFARSGTLLAPGAPILAAYGDAPALLRTWKVAASLPPRTLTGDKYASRLPIKRGAFSESSPAKCR